MKIEILGPGCLKCKKVEENIKQALKEVGKNAVIEKVTGINEIINRGVMATPAIIIDGKLKAFGRIPEIEEIRKWL